MYTIVRAVLDESRTVISFYKNTFVPYGVCVTNWLALGYFIVILDTYF